MLRKLPSKCRVEFCQQQINITDKSGLLGKFLDCWESFQIIWKVSILSGKLPNGLQSFWIVLKVIRLYGNILECWESCQMIWKVSHGLRSFWIIWTVGKVSR